MRSWWSGLVLLVLGCSQPVRAAEQVVVVNRVSVTGIGESLGTLRLVETPSGLRIEPQVRGLTPGPNGFHLHEYPSCRPGVVNGTVVAAGAAGGHWDPKGAGHAHHHGMAGIDHHPVGTAEHPPRPQGDLPDLLASAQGTATQPVLAPQFRMVSEVRNRTVIIHQGPTATRFACGVIAEPTRR